MTNYKNASRQRLKAREPKKYTAQQMRNSAYTRAKVLGIPFELSTEYIESICPDTCPVFGFKLIDGGRGGRKRYAPSLDRVVGALGYVESNIQIISNMANRMKSNASAEELVIFAEWICDLPTAV